MPTAVVQAQQGADGGSPRSTSSPGRSPGVHARPQVQLGGVTGPAVAATLCPPTQASKAAAEDRIKHSDALCTADHSGEDEVARAAAGDVRSSEGTTSEGDSQDKAHSSCGAPTQAPPDGTQEGGAGVAVMEERAAGPAGAAPTGREGTSTALARASATGEQSCVLRPADDRCMGHQQLEHAGTGIIEVDVLRFALCLQEPPALASSRL